MAERPKPEQATHEALAKRWIGIYEKEYRPNEWEKHHDVRETGPMTPYATALALHSQLERVLKTPENPVKLRSGIEERGTARRPLEEDEADKRIGNDRRMIGNNPIDAFERGHYLEVQTALKTSMNHAKAQGKTVPDDFEGKIGALMKTLQANSEKAVLEAFRDVPHVRTGEIGEQFRNAAIEAINKTSGMAKPGSEHAEIIAALREIRAKPSRAR